MRKQYRDKYYWQDEVPVVETGFTEQIERIKRYARRNRNKTRAKAVNTTRHTSNKETNQPDLI